MLHRRPSGLSAAAAAFLLALSWAASAGATVAVDSVASLNGTVTGSVPTGGRASAVGVLVAAGTSKGTLVVKAAKGSTLIPQVSLVAPDGTVRDQAALLAQGAKVKVTSKSVSITAIPVIDRSGLYKAVVTGAAGTDGKATSGGFTLKLGGKAPAGFTAPPGTISSAAQKVDFPVEIPENGLLSVTLKPSKTAPFSPSLKVIAASGDEIGYTDWSKVGKDDSITLKNMPAPFFGRYTLRVGSLSGTGAYTMVVKVAVSKKPAAPAGAPVADAGGSFVVEPGAIAQLDGTGTTGAASYLWVQVSGPALGIGNNRVAAPLFAAPAGRSTFAWQLVASNPTGASLPSLAILELDRAPVSDAGRSTALVSGAAQLDGSGSFDLDAGETLHYSWEQVSGPAAALDDPFSASPSFTPGATGSYVFALTVNDGVLSSESSLAVVSLGAAASAADAGRAVLVRPQDSVFLSGLRSRRGNGTAPTSWSWTPDGANTVPVTLAGANTPVASFTAPRKAARLRFRLAVDGDAAGADEVVVVVTSAIPENLTPVANVAKVSPVPLSAPFTLNGSGSHDDGSIAAYEWMQVDGPDAALLPAGASASGATPSSNAVLRFLLMVHDGRKYGAPDAAIVLAGSPDAPLADAGADVAGNPGTVLDLSSASSSPAPGGTITARHWTQLSGKDWYDVAAHPESGFDPSAANPRITVPAFISSLTANRTLSFSLAVTDGSGTGIEDLVAVVFQNLPRNASPQLTASTPFPVLRPGATGSLNSSATDADGDPLTFTWSQVSGPTAAITAANLPNASVTAPVVTGTLTYRVTVSDNTGEGNGTVSATVSFSVNQPPVPAVVATPAAGPEGTVVSLDASATTDPDDAGLSYQWTEIPPQSGTVVQLSGASTATASFTMPSYTGSIGARRRTFRLTVTDSMGPSSAVSANATFTPNRGPTAPVVTAVGDRKVFYSDSNATSDKSESLSVSSTVDADGDQLSFVWSVESGPITSTSVLLSSTGGATITFKSAPRPTQSQNSTGGVYTLGVVASDGVELGPKSTVDLLVTSSFTSDIYPFIQGGCLSSSCHGNTSFPAGNLFMGNSASTARTNLLTSRVTPNDYANSLFYTKLSSGLMPSTGAKWTQDMVNLVRDWIEPEWNATPKPGFSTGAENN
jgi:hypothetical protein